MPAWTSGLDPGDAALFTDLYELTMLHAYWREGMTDEAVFSLFSRKLPDPRNFMLACGLDDALGYLETFRFTGDAIAYLRSTSRFPDDFLAWLRGFRFTGDVYAVPEGTPVFGDEPIVEVVAPIAEAQLAETFVMNQIHFQTVAASKAARVVHAAAGRSVVDFGMRRMHGTDAALKAARAFYIAGVDATSDVLAGKRYGIPIAGTMAHSFIQAFDDERDAFRAFARVYPETILLVDTYDTEEGVRRVVDLARELGAEFRVSGVRLDSGDLLELAFRAREILDEAGLHRVEIFASGGLDENEIARMLAAGAPITGFGVGTRMGISTDAPALDMAYKLTAYAGRGRTKLSPGKGILPGRKQVFRIEEDGVAVRDVIARYDEAPPDGVDEARSGRRADAAHERPAASAPGRPGDAAPRRPVDSASARPSTAGTARPLLEQVMAGGQRLPAGRVDLERARRRAAAEIARLPDRLRGLEPADPPYLVEVSERLRADAAAAAAAVSPAPRRGSS